MKYILSIALKNILRSKRRTILTFMMLTFSVVFYIILSGMYAGMDKSSFENLIEFDTGHIKIRKADFNEEIPYSTDNIISDTTALVKKLSTYSFITGYTERFHFFAELDNGMDVTPVVVTGFDSKRDKDVFTLEKFIVEGTYDKSGAIMGIELAQNMNLSLGDIFYITFRNVDGSYVSIEVPVTAILFAADPMTNSQKVFLDLEIVKNIMGSQGATEVTIKTDNLDKASVYSQSLRENISGYDINSWQELSYEFSGVVNTKKKASNVILFIIMTIAMVGIVNTILISIYEKRREIGTLKAMGMIDSEVRNLFIAEGLFIGLAGSIIGSLVGALANIYFVYHGIDYSSISDQFASQSGAAIIGVIKSVWSFQDFFMIITLSTLASTLASYIPARKVMDMQPVDCLRTI